MAMAVADSVTVSIAAEITGILMLILFINRVFISTSLGFTLVDPGIRSTSSNVNA
jgi:hypothetical protein